MKIERGTLARVTGQRGRPTRVRQVRHTSWGYQVMLRSQPECWYPLEDITLMPNIPELVEDVKRG